MPSAECPHDCNAAGLKRGKLCLPAVPTLAQLPTRFRVDVESPRKVKGVVEGAKGASDMFTRTRTTSHLQYHHWHGWMSHAPRPTPLSPSMARRRIERTTGDSSIPHTSTRKREQRHRACVNEFFLTLSVVAVATPGWVVAAKCFRRVRRRGDLPRVSIALRQCPSARPRWPVPNNESCDCEWWW